MIEAGEKPNVTTYNTLMNAYGTNHVEAEKVLKRMKIDKVTPNVETYNTLMNAYGANHVEAEKVLTRMKEDGVQPDAVTHRTLMKSCEWNKSKGVM